MGLTIEDELINVLLQELKQASLPLLQFALDELWQKRTPGKLTLANYQKNIGGLGAILGKKAQETLNKMNPEQQECAQAIFQDLVQLGEGKEDTRRRIPREKLVKTKYQDVFDSTLKELVAVRLLVISSDANNILTANPSPIEEKPQTTVEIAHEILIRNWNILREWLDTNRSQILLGRELEQKAYEWVNTRKENKNDFLLPEGGLIKYHDLYKDRTDELSEEVKQFIKLSNEKCARLKKEEETRRIKELEQERKARINAQRFSWSLVIGLIASFSLTGLAGWQWQKSRINEINALINTSKALSGSNQKFDALLIGLKAGKQIRNNGFGIEYDNKIKLLGNLQVILSQIQELNRIENHQDSVNKIIFSPDGKLIASASADRTVKLWSLNGELIKTMSNHTDIVNEIEFSPDGELIASASKDGTLKIWNWREEKIESITGANTVVNQISFSLDSKKIAATGKDGTIILHNLKSSSI